MQPRPVYDEQQPKRIESSHSGGKYDAELTFQIGLGNHTCSKMTAHGGIPMLDCDVCADAYSTQEERVVRLVQTFVR